MKEHEDVIASQTEIIASLQSMVNSQAGIIKELDKEVASWKNDAGDREAVIDSLMNEKILLEDKIESFEQRIIESINELTGGK